MALILREYLESPITTIDNEVMNNNINLNESFSNCDPISNDSIMVDIEGIHVGPTRNFTWYTEEALKNSQKSWSIPYQRPFILHHNEKDGKIIGRVLNASYTTSHTRSNTGALLFTCNVSDKDGKEGVKDGRLKTASIGVIAKKVTCSICGNDITLNGECEHERGEIYNNERCYWKVHDMEAKELSYVIVPSDVYSHNVRIYSPKSNNLKESLDNEKEVLIVKDNTNLEKEVEVKESTNVEAEVIENTNAEITSLKEELEKVKAENINLKELKENAENEIIELTSQLKEMAIEQISYLREKLGRPTLLKENLQKRNQDSLMDSILDLKEELDIVTSNKKINIKESLENNEEKNEIVSNINTNTISNTNNNADGISTIENLKEVKSDVLVDNNKDSLNKSENYSDLDVKESLDYSNKDYEESIEKIQNFYKL